ncbi:MAG: lipoyl synthase [Spirochaetia bacterium]|nr:lipoyl synthase [Spirochaetia bacterium]
MIQPKNKPSPKPEWLRVPIRSGGNLNSVKRLLKELHLNTVCEAANCPNRMECFSSRTATFMILGDICTRNCRFCDVPVGKAQAVQPDEPARLAQAVVELGLVHVVITSVTRDDLPDGGAGHFAATVQAIRAQKPEATIEPLIPDLQGNQDALKTVLDSGPDILNHNLETIPRLYSQVRPQADYRQSLEVLRAAKQLNPRVYTKSGLMVGLGESVGEIETVMDDLRSVDCDFLTIGQYLPPSKGHFPVAEYIHPDTFKAYQRTGYQKGFAFVASAPFVRSSYKAAEMTSAIV